MGRLNTCSAMQLGLRVTRMPQEPSTYKDDLNTGEKHPTALSRAAICGHAIGLKKACRH